MTAIIPPAHDSDSSDDVARGGLFESTPWTAVQVASDSQHAIRRTALEKLCKIYWPPLYTYALRKVSQVDLAQDLTQSFFERLLSGKSLKLADPARGRFRTFLLQAFEWHLANVFRERRAAKRGGNVRILDLDFSAHHDALADNKSLTAEQVFEREWALTLLNLTMDQLRNEQAALDKLNQFEILKFFLAGDCPEVSYSSVCRQLNMQESAARMAVSRLRTRYRELLREEILRTVASNQDVDDEIRQMFRALSTP